MKIRELIAKQKFIQIFLLAYFCFGIWTMPKFGVPIDELTQRFIGIENNRYISGAADAETVLKNKYYGPFFESISYGLEQIIYNQPLRVKLYMRHIVLFLIFIIALNCFYQISRQLFKHKGTAEMSTFMLGLYPPLFAHAHYNSKDTFFLELIIFCIYFLSKYHQNPKLKWVIYMAIVIGIATSIRFLGIFMLVSFFIGLCFIPNKTVVEKFRIMAPVIGVSVASFYLVFPLFWTNPINGLGVLWQYITHNPWPWEELVAGVWVQPDMQPWWYLPVWLGVSIPVLVLLIFVVGIWVVLKQIKKGEKALLMSIVCLFILPFLYTILFSPTLYDGWRHVQFLIVPIFLIAGFGIVFLLNIVKSKLVFYTLGMYTLLTFWTIHPFQYVYFNEIYLTFFKRNTFSQDYWGLSANRCMEWINSQESNSAILISSSTNAPELNELWMNPTRNNKFYFTQKTGAGKYEIQIKRDHTFKKVNGTEVFMICPLKDTIARVVRMH